MALSRINYLIIQKACDAKARDIPTKRAPAVNTISPIVMPGKESQPNCNTFPVGANFAPHFSLSITVKKDTVFKERIDR